MKPLTTPARPEAVASGPAEKIGWGFQLNDRVRVSSANFSITIYWWPCPILYKPDNKFPKRFSSGTINMVSLRRPSEGIRPSAGRSKFGEIWMLARRESNRVGSDLFRENKTSTSDWSPDKCGNMHNRKVTESLLGRTVEHRGGSFSCRYEQFESITMIGKHAHNCVFCRLLYCSIRSGTYPGPLSGYSLWAHLKMLPSYHVFISPSRKNPTHWLCGSEYDQCILYGAPFLIFHNNYSPSLPRFWCHSKCKTDLYQI